MQFVNSYTGPTAKLDNEKGDLLPDARRYRTVVGMLNHLIISWPNIAAAISFVSHFMDASRTLD